LRGLWRKARGGEGNVHIGVTPVRGAETPRYRPYVQSQLPLSDNRKPVSKHTFAPSRPTICRTTSIAPLYTPLSAVCKRTLTRSKGCPTRTAQTPPAPPATSERNDCSDDFVASTAACSTSAGEGSLSIGEEDEEEDMAEFCRERRDCIGLEALKMLERRMCAER